MTFGHTRHKLTDDSYESDFGILVTLNAVDPDRIRNTDVSEPAAVRRRRTQLPMGAALTYFDIDQDSSILSSLTGIVKEHYASVISAVTGSSSLRCSSPLSANRLAELGSQALELYTSEEYRSTFPRIHDIKPLRDKAVCSKCDDGLVHALRHADPNVQLCIPSILDYSQSLRYRFVGAGGRLSYDDATISNYTEYLGARGFDISSLSREHLDRHKIQVIDDHDNVVGSFTLRRALIYEVADSDHGTIHLSEGSWFAVAEEYVVGLDTFLAARMVDLPLPAFDDADEARYNQRVGNIEGMICMDKSNMAPAGHTQVEPCDICFELDDKAVFVHVKRWRRSADFSHMVNQGAIALELIKSERGYREGLVKRLVECGASKPLVGASRSGKYVVAYAIIHRGDRSLGHRLLPVFSRIALKHAIRRMEMMGARVEVGLITDESPSGRV